jgi:hypothetical protein
VIGLVALSGTGCATTEPLLGFVCSGDPTLVQVADVFRWLCMVLGVLVTAAYLRLAFDRRARLLTGLVWRLAGATLAAYYVSVTEWDRLHDPVTLRLPLGVVALTCLTVGAWKYRPPVTADDDIDARIERIERLNRPSSA